MVVAVITVTIVIFIIPSTGLSSVLLAKKKGSIFLSNY